MVWVSHRRSPQLCARSSDAAEYEGRAEVNQLKYTCHALHKETAGWEAKFNRVVVCTHAADPRPVELFSSFLATCASAKAAWFTDLDLIFNAQAKHRGQRSVRTMMNQLLEPPGLSCVAGFCRRHPHVNVRCLLWGFDVSLHAGQFMAIGCLLTKVFRRGDAANRIWQNRIITESIIVDSPWAKSPAIVAAGALPNLRVWPHGKCLDEDRLRQLLKEFRSILKVDACVEFTKEWYTSGI
jgi:hypothetical protein